MKIAVLAGGTSTERTVSFQTGKMVADALKNNGHDICFLDVYTGINEDINIDEAFNQTDFDSLATGISEIAPNIEELKKLDRPGSDGFFGKNVLNICKAADCVFLALHGANGEDGRIQATFELLGIPYTGSGSVGSLLAMHKGISKQVMNEANVPNPKGIMLRRGQETENTIGLPCVIKPCSGGSSVGVSIVNDESGYKEALSNAFSFEDEILVEQYIKGREFSVGLLDGKALPIIEIEPLTGFYDYKNKYQSGLTKETCPANLSENITLKMQHYAEVLYSALHLKVYSRIDFLLDESNNLYCLEANTLPGMTATSLLPQEAASIGINFNDLCEMIVQNSLNK